MKKQLNKVTKWLAVSMAGILGLSTLSVQSSAATRNYEEEAKVIVSQMTLEEKIGQMLMPAIRTWKDGNGNSSNVTSLNEELTAAIEKYKFGGIILFAQNVENTQQTVKLIDQIQMASKYPALISIDQEGGIVTRIGTGTNFGGNMSLTATGDIHDTYMVSNAIGEELNALGIQIDFAPVMDVNSNPGNPVIGVRSFSDDPIVVQQQGITYIQGLHQAGVASALKHFPGHGDTNVDSHTGLPGIDKSLEQLKQCELIPFKAGIDADTDIIMTAHIQYPQIEKTTYRAKNGKTITLPATLSKTMITEVLRNQLGFDGVVTTDALNMGAIADLFTEKDVARLALNADVDVLLMPVDLSTSAGIENMEIYISNIVNMVSNGEINIETINKSVQRIVVLKLKYGIMNPDGTRADKVLANEAERIDNALKTVGCATHRNLDWEVAKKSVTMLKNDNGTIPLNQDDSKSVAILCPYNSEINNINKAIARLQQDKLLLPQTTCTALSYEKKKISDMEDIVKKYDTYIVISEMSGIASITPTNEKGWQSVFIDGLNKEAHEQNKKVVLISAQLPYDAARYQQADTILLTYCSKNAAFNIAAAINYVFDTTLPQGKLPVNIYTLDKNMKYTDQILYSSTSLSK